MRKNRYNPNSGKKEPAPARQEANRELLARFIDDIATNHRLRRPIPAPMSHVILQSDDHNAREFRKVMRRNGLMLGEGETPPPHTSRAYVISEFAVTECLRAAAPSLLDGLHRPVRPGEVEVVIFANGCISVFYLLEAGILAPDPSNPPPERN